MLEAALAEEILVVEAQFLERGAGDVGEFELGLLRGATGLAALGNVLHAAAGGLHHLVVGAAARWDVAVAELGREIVAELRELEALQVTVAAVRRNQVWGAHRALLENGASLRRAPWRGKGKKE